MKFDFCVACYLHFMSIRFIHVLHIVCPSIPVLSPNPTILPSLSITLIFLQICFFFFKPSCMTLSFNFVAKLASNARLTISTRHMSWSGSTPTHCDRIYRQINTKLKKENYISYSSLHRQMPHFLLTAWSLSLFPSYFAKFHRRYLSLRMIQWLQSTRQRHENDTFIV